MLKAIDTPRSFAAGRTYEQYLEDRMFQAAVEREFEILGEALVRLRRDDPRTAIRFREPWKIVGFRNVLVHKYDEVNLCGS